MNFNLTGIEISIIQTIFYSKYIHHSYILHVVLVIIMEFHWFIGRDALCIIHQ